MRNLLVLAAAIVLVGTGCGKKGAESCAPLQVTVDGKPLELKTFLGVEQNKQGYLVYGFNHDKATCEEVLKTSRTVPEGEISVRAWVPSGGGGFPASVGIDFHTQMGVKSSLAIKPEKPGDDVAICVEKKAEFSPSMGGMKDKPVTFVGLLKGKYCGPMSF